MDLVYCGKNAAFYADDLTPAKDEPIDPETRCAIECYPQQIEQFP